MLGNSVEVLRLFGDAVCLFSKHFVSKFEHVELGSSDVTLVQGCDLWKRYVGQGPSFGRRRSGVRNCRAPQSDGGRSSTPARMIRRYGELRLKGFQFWSVGTQQILVDSESNRGCCFSESLPKSRSIRRSWVTGRTNGPPRDVMHFKIGCMLNRLFVLTSSCPYITSVSGSKIKDTAFKKSGLFSH